MATTLENDTTTTTRTHEDVSSDVFEPTEASPTDVHPSVVSSDAQGLSIASLVLGIASFVFGFSFIVPAAGVVLGIMALKREPAGKTLAVIGIVTSALNLGWILIAALGLALAIPFAGLFLPWII